MIGQVHALKSCIRLSVKWRRVSGLKNQIGHGHVWPSLREFLKDYGEVKLLL